MWSYSGSPGDSDLDEVRFISQLIDSSNERLSDEEIGWILTQEDTSVGAAARCCETLANRYAEEIDTRTGAAGELSIKGSQLSSQFAKRAVDLRRESSKHASPWAASISESEKLAQEERTDRVEPAFTRDQFGGEGAGQDPSPEWNQDGYR